MSHPVEGPAADRGQRKTRLGIVTSNKMQKTIVVQVRQLTRHPLYERTVPRTNSFKAHDERSEAKPGDWVKIMETRPLSKDKRWRLVEIIQRASSAPPIPATPEEVQAEAKPYKTVKHKPLPEGSEAT